MSISKRQLLMKPVLLVILSIIFFSNYQLSEAQSITGTVSGTVYDSTDNVVSNASITLTAERTNDSRTVVTNENGQFVFVSVLPGAYTVKVEQKGFRTFVRKGNNLSANEHLSIGKVQLEIGELTESVTTVAEGTAVQTESVEHSAQITSKQMEMLSMRGRDVMSMLTILPGVSYSGQSESAGGGFGSGSPNIQGNRNTTNTMNVDGVRGNDLGSPNVFSSTVNFDAISEVKVLLNGYQAEYASNSSAGINIITKPGTSQYHGSGYWYKRHEMFNANSFFNNKKGRNADGSEVAPNPRYRYSTLGFTLGGPVWIPKYGDKLKEKLFFFYSFEDSQILSPGGLQTVTVPTELERIGDFSQSAVKPKDSTGKEYSIIPQDKINKNGLALLSVFPKPNFTNTAISKGEYNYVYQESLKVPKRQHLVRADYKLSEKDTFYVRGSTWFADNQGSSVPAGVSAWGLAKLHYTYTDNGIAGNWTHIFSPTLVNEALVGLRHGVEKGPTLDDQELAKMQSASYGFTLGQLHPELNPLGVLPRYSFGSTYKNAAAVSYDGRFPLRGADTLISFNDTISLIRGTHTYKAGFYVERVRNYEGDTSTFAGEFNFGTSALNPLDSKNPYANALLGVFTSYAESTARPRGEGRQTIAEWFIQDSWKVKPRLSLEYGVRFGWYNHWYQDRGAAAAFSLDRYDRAKAPTYYQPYCNVALVKGICAEKDRRVINPLAKANDPNRILPYNYLGAFVPNSGNPYNGMVLGTDETYPRGFRNQQPVQIQPRFGFAWDIKGDGKTALRGSVGVFNQTRVSGNVVWNDVSRNPPISETPSILNGRMSDIASSSGVYFPSSVAGFDPDNKTPVTYNYTLNLQRNIGFGTVVDIGYVGSVSRHLQQYRNINAIPYGSRFSAENANPIIAGTALPDNYLRPYSGYGNINYYENVGNSNYNSLQVTANRRFARGVQFGLAYTWSKAMDEVDGDRDSTATYQTRRNWHYGKAGFDQTHIFVLNYTWDMPRASRIVNHKIVRGLFDNWQLSGITAFVSGTPSGISYTLKPDGNPATDITGGGDGARLVLVGNPIISKSERNIDKWFNTAAFAIPNRGQYGNLAKDIIRLPGTNNWDMTLFKKIPLKSDSRYFQLRWEVYNVFNHTQFSSLDTAAEFNVLTREMTDKEFGKATGARAPRRMQMSLRLVF